MGGGGYIKLGALVNGIPTGGNINYTTSSTADTLGPV